MRRPPGAPASVLASLLAAGVLLLSGCGDEAGPVATDPAPEPAPSSTAVPDVPAETPTDDPTDQPTTAPTKSPPLQPGGVPFELIEIVSGSAGDGTVSPQAVPITSQAEAETFVVDFSDDLAAEVLTALTEALTGRGDQVHAAVVGVSCDVPPGVAVSQSTAGYEIVGLKVAVPTPECYAPVTSVAVVAIP